MQIVSQPIDYSIDIINPQKAMLESLQYRAMQEKYAAEQKEQEDFATAYSNFMSIEKPTTKDAALFMTKVPASMQERFKPLMQNISEEQSKASLNFGLKVMNALESDPAVAINLLRERATAETNSGNQENASFFEQLAKTAEKDPGGAMKVSSLVLASIPGAKEALENISKARGEQREAEMQPFKIGQAAADAQLKQIQARFAPQKMALDLQLSQEQLNNLKKSKEEQGLGIIPLEKRPEAEAKFRKEYSDQTKAYQDVKASYARVLASNEDAAGDLALIFNYMKMLDPGSVVKETEFANAENAAGVPDRIRNQWNKLLEGKKLNPDQRVMFKKQAESLYKQSLKQEDTVRKGIERIATGYGLKPENIFYEPTESQPTAPTTEDNSGLPPLPAGFTRVK